jgi:hypothetical protein
MAGARGAQGGSGGLKLPSAGSTRVQGPATQGVRCRPRAPGGRQLAHIDGSSLRPIVRSTARSLPISLGAQSVTATPEAPARPVRPTRCT